MALVERSPLWGARICNMTIFFREHNMFTVLCSCSLSHNDNDNPVIYNIKYSDRNIHQKFEKNFERK